MSFYKAWASCRDPIPWRDGDMTSLCKWSPGVKLLKRSPITAFPRHLITISLTKNLQKLQLPAWPVVFHDLSAWHFHLPRLLCCVLFQPIQTTQSFPNLPGCLRHTLDCPSLSCLPVTYLFLFYNSSDILFSIVPIRIKASRVKRFCLNVSLIFGLESLKALGQSLVCSWYSKHVCWPEAYNTHLQSEYNNFQGVGKH